MLRGKPTVSVRFIDGKALFVLLVSACKVCVSHQYGCLWVPSTAHCELHQILLGPDSRGTWKGQTTNTTHELTIDIDSKIPKWAMLNNMGLRNRFPGMICQLSSGI